jgi:hypothetical protein
MTDFLKSVHAGVKSLLTSHIIGAGTFFLGEHGSKALRHQILVDQ